MVKINFSHSYVLVIFIINIIAGIPRNKRSIGSYDIKLWTNKTIPYLLDNSFSDSDLSNFHIAIDSYQSETCLQFVRYQPNIHPNWLKIKNGEKCFSEIGMQDTGQQSLTLSQACRQYGLIIHELGHTIGLLHEMMRPDRNQFIRYFIENIQDEAKIGFEIESTHYKLFNTPFDFQSIMMYSPYAFSKNGLPVYMKMNKTEKSPIFEVREKDLSYWDIKAINALYKCGNHCSNVNCPTAHFLDKNCVCQTPEMFANRRCVDNANHTEYCRNASETNICYNKPITSSTLCRKTCGRCFRYGNYGNGLPPPYKCMDQDEVKCKKKKIDGFCYFDTWTKVYCKKSCNTCVNHTDLSIIEFVCKDRHNADLCEEWAQNGQCNINPGFMKSNCALSCGTCSTNTTLTKPNAPCRNYSPDSYCDAMANENKCTGTTLKICLGSCGKCGSNYERNEANLTETEIAKNHQAKTRPECKDLISNCQFFANEGQCQNHKETMKYHCAKTCNFCLHDSCKNEDSEDVCDAVRQRGLCTSHAGFANRCQKTCKICQNMGTNLTTECKDRDALYLCQEVVRRYQCNSDRGYRCRYSCNLCSETEIKSTTTRVNESVTTAQCNNEDNEENCENLKNQGLCESFLHRAVLCRKSCNLCTLPITTTTAATICINSEDEENCNSWASTGYCNENEEYMRENCAKACKFCKSNDATSVTTYNGNSQCKNKESAEICRSWVHRGYCTDYVGHMTINCPESCGFCNWKSTTSLGTTTKVIEICKNTESDELCESWSQNYCSVSHIADLCKKTCNICQ